MKLKTVSECNALPDDAVSSATLNQFKNRLERHVKAVQYVVSDMMGSKSTDTTIDLTVTEVFDLSTWSEEKGEM